MSKNHFPNIYDVAGLPNLLTNNSKPNDESRTPPQKLTFYLSSDLAERLDLIARARSLSRSAFVAQLVKKELSSPTSLELENRMRSLSDSIS